MLDMYREASASSGSTSKLDSRVGGNQVPLRRVGALNDIDLPAGRVGGAVLLVEGPDWGVVSQVIIDATYV